MKRILVFDDDRNFCRSVGSDLVDEGYQVLEAYTDDEAKEILERENEGLHVALLDMFVDHPTSGLELINYMRDKGLSVVPVVVTDYGDLKNAIESLEAGAFGYVLKGTQDQAQNIRQTVRGAIQLRRNRNLARATGDLKRAFRRFREEVGEFLGVLKRLEDELPEGEGRGNASTGNSSSRSAD